MCPSLNQLILVFQTTYQLVRRLLKNMQFHCLKRSKERKQVLKMTFTDGLHWMINGLRPVKLGALAKHGPKILQLVTFCSIDRAYAPLKDQQ